MQPQGLLGTPGFAYGRKKEGKGQSLLVLGPFPLPSKVSEGKGVLGLHSSTRVHINRGSWRQMLLWAKLHPPNFLC